MNICFIFAYITKVYPSDSNYISRNHPFIHCMKPIQLLLKPVKSCTVYIEPNTLHAPNIAESSSI